MATATRSIQSQEAINVSRNHPSPGRASDDDLYNVSPRHAALKSSAHNTSNAVTSNTSKTSIMAGPSKPSTGKLKKPGTLDALRAKANGTAPQQESQQFEIPEDDVQSPQMPAKKTRNPASAPIPPVKGAQKGAAPASKPQGVPAAKSNAKAKASAAPPKTEKFEPKEKPAVKRKRGSKTATHDSDEYDPAPAKKRTRAQNAAEKPPPPPAPAQEAAKPVTRRGKQAVKKGNSPEYISSGDESSESEEEEEPTKPPQTPVAVPSSPPQPETRKATVIAFDKSGPRNQGQKRPPGSAIPSSKMKSGATHRAGPSSAATSFRTSMSGRPAAPSNVANSFGDALAAFSVKGKASAAPSMPESSKTPALNRESRPTIMPESPSKPLQTALGDAGATLQDDGGFVNIDDMDDQEQLANEPAAPEQSPERVAKRTKLSVQQSSEPIEPAPPTPDGVAEIEDKARDGTNEVADITAQAFKSAPRLDPEQPKRKDEMTSTRSRPAISPAKSSGPSQESDEVISHSKSYKFERSEPPKQQRHEAPISKVDELHPRKRKASAAFAAVESAPEASQNSLRRRSQQISQGSQTVDLNGSPVPLDFDVGKQATVLEVYSQQTSLSSDPAEPLQQPNFTKNKKTKPASPRAESQLVSRVALDQKYSPSVALLAGKAGVHVKGMRTSTQKERPQYAAEHDRQAHEEPQDGEDEEGDWGEDPDNTLVDDEEEAMPTQHVKKTPKQFSKPGESRFEPLSDDLMVWCNTLKPHQLDFFEELVKVSRDVVDFTVHQENSNLRMLETQHKQGLLRIEKEELARAKRHQDLTLKLQQARRERKRKLRTAEENIKTAITNHEAVVQEREEKYLARQEETRQIERVLAKHE